MAAADFSAAQSLRIGSAPLSEQLVGQIRQALPHVRILHGYGTTEAGPVAFASHDQMPLSVGTAHPAVDLRLIRDGTEVTDEGVLEMRCPALMNGYHKLPDVTRKAMTEDGYYRTGDVMRRDAHGFYYFVGRADDMFVCGGENIYPGEVERLLERHPAIQQRPWCPWPTRCAARNPWHSWWPPPEPPSPQRW